MCHEILIIESVHSSMPDMAQQTHCWLTKTSSWKKNLMTSCVAKI